MVVRFYQCKVLHVKEFKVVPEEMFLPPQFSFRIKFDFEVVFLFFFPAPNTLEHAHEASI